MIARVACCVLVLALGRAVSAQAPSQIADPSTAQIRVGVLGLTPRLAITDVGVDTNVFATPDNPQRDVTATASTGTDIWLRTGRGLLNIGANSEYVHFEKFSSERGFNTDARAVYEFRLNRFIPFAAGGTRNFKERPNEEIVARVRGYQTEYGGGLSARLFSRTTARAEWHRRVSGFADTARYDGHDLRTHLNQRRDTSELSLRQQLTALTAFVTRVAHDRNRFEFANERDSESIYVNAGFEFGEFALIRGAAMFGYHHLRADNPAVLPEFSGFTTNVNVAYTAPSQTRIHALIGRALQQSYDPLTPHYTQLTWSGAVTQRVFGRWDVQLAGGRARQDYLSTPLSSGRTDSTDRVGGGIGYVLASRVRASFDISAVTRTSQVPLRDYSGIVGGFSVAYGY